ncbi:ATP-dependent Clp protease adaptor protein ClpS [Antricoccus suffuscus]|uniref:ATP-dependent Clp protease adaptor protein ClpS n=2 Tax=Antricoccus suffuscus TaxID=1629062 RepID=A0A2T0Z2B2_9ACTN|nr:ATP-dependent Clp protease adaptor protein ClpS [Antricoccus suffuscus]
MDGPHRHDRRMRAAVVGEPWNNGPMLKVSESATAVPEQREEIASDESVEHEGQWVTIVWNDPVNLMSYVTYVFKNLFGYDEPTATKLMLDVHEKGKAVVSTGAKESMEHDTTRLHAAGLWATFQPA